MGDTNISLDIVRESDDTEHWLNRICRNHDTGKALYYCDVTPDSALHVRRNGKGGPSVAEVTACLVTPGLTDVNFSSPLHTVELDHLHTDEIKDMTRFSVDGEFYYWKNHSELIRVRDGELLAEFIPSWLVVDVNEHKLGRLVVKKVEKPSLDVIVTTAMVVQERADEARKAVRVHRRL